MPRPPPEPSGPVQHILNLEHRPALGRDSFLESASNAEALAWIGHWPDWPAPALVLFGPHGCGKTHLAEIWREKADAVSIPVSLCAESVLPEIIAANRSVSLDNADSRTGQDDYERTLFHLYNSLKENGLSLLITGASPASRWNIGLPDLKSRLLAAPTVSIGPPDDELLRKLFGKLFVDRQVHVPDEVIDYLLPRMERSFAAANRLALRLDEVALSQKRPITISIAKIVLDENFKD